MIKPAQNLTVADNSIKNGSRAKYFNQEAERQ
jgi:hypothetical protein